VKHIIFKIIKNILKVLLFFLIVIFLMPNKLVSPIEKKNFIKVDPESFWYFPWGESGVHKGIDIFCKEDAVVLAPVFGLIIETGNGNISGNYIYVLGPKFRKYYFAHLKSVFVKKGFFISKGSIIGIAGNTGNAINKHTHLHFSIETIIPYFWLNDPNTLQGEEKMYYLNPNKYIEF
jgi:peptidoglycan LD-endopeptidase LytH